ncbi:TetR/AcrR family transcriptional regulator [Actinobaculum suis]|uniref:TetR/AcrR family transcriptional regulator n=1 Tax=Actinobaculum suis TaxID=1657 RepID=UPI00080A6E4C|nr:TetR/AcrR family transcriptional regulator [Actinobaculum suis]OCA96016.1 TetR family transcriptional regulator [Actinobaculum suis]
MTKQRRTGKELEDALAAAIMEELAAQGYQNLSFEGVARAAQTSKSVLYRRFASRAEMVVFAALRTAPAMLHDVATAPSLRAAFVALIEATRTRLDHIGISALFGLLSEAGPEVREELLTTTVLPGFVALTNSYKFAIARGELSETVLEPLYIRFPLLLLVGDILARGAIDEAELLSLVDHIIIPHLKNVSKPEENSTP